MRIFFFDTKIKYIKTLKAKPNTFVEENEKTSNEEDIIETNKSN